MKRRDFLAGIGAAATSASLGFSNVYRKAPSAKGPNILFIMTDQQFSEVLSFRLGKQFLYTPAMDRLAETGTVFTRAYSPNPICVPARCSMLTGRYPHETGVQDNSNRDSLEGKFPCMGKVFKDGGYDTGYVGKWHVNFDEENKAVHGFDYTAVLKSNRYDNQRPEALREFLKRKRSQPFFLVASFNNPHNICEWARGEELPEGPIGDPPAPENCPPSKPNRFPPKNETDTIAMMRKSYHNTKMFPVGDFSEGKWRQFIWAYYRLVEKVDALIGELLQDVEETGYGDNTLILLTSDHGDCHGAHRFNQKSVFFEESTRVPFIVNFPGVVKKGVSDKLVQTGIDILPTLCDFAGINAPDGLPGLSVRPIAEGRGTSSWRSYTVTSNHMIQGGPVGDTVPKIHGRMVRSENYKYCLYSHGERREDLFDMVKDPGETENLAGDKACAEILKQHRAMLEEHAKRYGDELALQMLDPAYKGEPFEKA